jgi:hypothetical protein
MAERDGNADPARADISFFNAEERRYMNQKVVIRQ